MDVVHRFNRSMNLKADPCADFFDYACGNNKRENDVFSEMGEKNDLKIIEALEKLQNNLTKVVFGFIVAKQSNNFKKIDRLKLSLLTDVDSRFLFFSFFLR